MMKRLLWFAALLIFAAVAAMPVLAADDPQVGTWKLNVAKSKFVGTPAPKELTRVVETEGSGVKYSFSGTTADGKAIKYGFSTKLDGSDSSISGDAPSGIDTVAIKKVSASKWTVTQSKGGKQLTTGSATVSKDGKTVTVVIKGKNPEGKTLSTTSVYEKQ
jgi:hypothetical protein